MALNTVYCLCSETNCIKSCILDKDRLTEPDACPEPQATRGSLPVEELPLKMLHVSLTWTVGQHQAMQIVGLQRGGLVLLPILRRMYKYKTKPLVIGRRKKPWKREYPTDGLISSDQQSKVTQSSPPRPKHCSSPSSCKPPRTQATASRNKIFHSTRRKEEA